MKKWLSVLAIAILGLALVIGVACGGGEEKEGTAQAKDGDTVQVHYTLKLEDGTVFETSIGRDPLQFTIGEGQLIPGFEQAVVGMSPGESKTVEIPADEAYPYREELVMVVDRDLLPEDLQPEVGQQLQISQPSGETIVVKVIDVSELSVTLDANHPLAGKDLTFDIELVEIK
jgi:FKBP-type peptidyl-prolyl cis-trans isomerase 2